MVDFGFKTCPGFYKTAYVALGDPLDDFVKQFSKEATGRYG